MTVESAEANSRQVIARNHFRVPFTNFAPKKLSRERCARNDELRHADFVVVTSLLPPLYLSYSAWRCRLCNASSNCSTLRALLVVSERHEERLILLRKTLRLIHVIATLRSQQTHYGRHETHVCRRKAAGHFGSLPQHQTGLHRKGDSRSRIQSWRQRQHVSTKHHDASVALVRLCRRVTHLIVLTESHSQRRRCESEFGG